MILGSTSARVAAVYTAAFALAVALLGATTILATRTALASQFDDRIRTELAAVRVDYDSEGFTGLVDEMNERSANPGELWFGLRTVAGAPIKGALAQVAAPAGWSVAHIRAGGRERTLRVLAEDLPGGYRLMAADDVARMQGLDRSVVIGFALAFLGVVAIGAAGGFALSRDMHRRLAAISGTAEAIIDGDLARRVPIERGGGDLGRLAGTVNRMLDRIGVLVDSLRQVSSDIAHDLRTPLTRLRQRLELSLQHTDDPGRRVEIEGALRDVDSILRTFGALLRIAQVDAGARRAAFRPLDLAALAQAVFDDYAPAAEDGGRTMTLDADRPVWIEGDPALVSQLLVNLVENALAHTPAGVKVELSAYAGDQGQVLSVRDHGLGAPDEERERLFDRFYRMERSRSTPGSGLGLALVAAIARLHRAEVSLDNAAPGLEARVVFPAPVSGP
ncbi:MAG TPA: HAMP domain-containing sensor histidine kinase [Caulobacteraceae bacterium]|nr:HAMP domain-containing sensor histidine kinase [Caulobacteraceae bacterium]